MGTTGAGRVFLLGLVVLLALQTPASAVKQSYVIFFSNFPASPSALLATITNDLTIFPYNLRAINSIALRIDESFLPRLQTLPGVVAVIPDKLYKPHTTHSWDFLGLASRGEITPAWSSARLGEGTIIGVIDTGVSPESRSFKNDTMASVQSLGSRWRGTCNKGSDTNFECDNRKLIGAKFFSFGMQAGGFLGDGAQQPSEVDLTSPRDFVGHGSHTMSTAGGSFVPGASVFGHGNGTAVGGAPAARVAMYKACYAPAGCSGIDILEAILEAVKDGVHVLSLSLGAPPGDYLTDPIAIGAFFAVQSGVTVVCSAGNSGPQPSTVSNHAPWIFTVAASTMDRDFPAYVSFNGGSDTIQGQSLANSTVPIGQPKQMISGEKANALNRPTGNSSLCLPGSLDRAKVQGKIVVCVRGVNARVEKGLVVKEAGGAGMVLCNDAASGDSVIADPHVLPAAHCSFSECTKLFNYLNNAAEPSGYINATDARFGLKPAPKMAAFSSRGPNAITPQILKPDITAPGVSIIAAFSENVSATGFPSDNRTVPYNILSGTSMSCPHVSGIVALLKTKYPTWTPAMIKSAIMTTANTTANDGKPIQDEAGGVATPFGYGSGHVDPVKALDPGLVYNTTLADYTNFICSLKPTQNPGLPVDLPPALGDLTQPVINPVVNLVFPLFDAAGDPLKCSQGPFGRPEDLNYPSIAVPCLSGSTTVKRRLTNVAGTPSKYRVTVTDPVGFKITVVPSELDFGVGEEKEFMVNLDVINAPANDYVFGSIVWSDVDKAHDVRSPVVVRNTKCG